MICVTGGERTFEALRRRVAVCRDTDVMQEVRLDLLRQADRRRPELLELLGSGRIIATCRPARDGGGFTGGEEQRIALLERVLERQPAYLDLEATVPEAQRRRLVEQKGNTRLILSWHHFEPTSLDELAQLLKLAPRDGDVLKLAVAVQDAADLLPLLALRSSVDRPLVLIGIGPAGLLSRALYHRFGSPWTYVVPDGTAPVAPGQLTVAEARAWRIARRDLVPIGLLGGPAIERSPGPRVHNQVFATRDIHHTYLPVMSTRIEQALALLAELGFAGSSVTIPVKQDAAHLVGELRPPADALQTVNTLVRRDGEWIGSNTDVGAVTTLLSPHVTSWSTALVLGAGGAARAAAFALHKLGCSVSVSARRIGAARELAHQLGIAAVAWQDRGQHPFQILVNATPANDEALMPQGIDWSERVVLDAVLAHHTPLLDQARRGGAEVIDGHAWWVLQGSQQLTVMTGELFQPTELQRLMDQPTAQAVERVVSFRAPGSKSMTQRALMLAGLTHGESTLLDPLDCDDSLALRRALLVLGVRVRQTEATWQIQGGAPSACTEPLWCGEAGTTSRFLAPIALLTDQLRLDGGERLRQRPLQPLLDALTRLGVQVKRDNHEDSLPVTLAKGETLSQTWVDVSTSSQFLSGLLLVAPMLPRGLTLEARPAPVSQPYLDLTLQAMRAFGVEVQVDGQRYRVPHQPYQPCRYQIEGDWSGAAFLLAGGYLVGRSVQLENTNPASVQGDRAIVDFLRQLALGRHRFDLTDCPDLIAPLAAASVTSRHPVEIVGVRHARLKESDRVAVLARGLRAVGVSAEEGDDGLSIAPHTGDLLPASLDPASDHRMAMAFGLLSLLQPGIEVEDPDCVSKSYPGFWEHLERLR